MKIKKILVANRGEIACRIIRAAREMSIATVAVYSETDRLSVHVQMADEAISIGRDELTLSYLDYSKIIQVSKITNCDAIHPGYGFLSENKEFAQKVIEAGLIFIGPDPKTIGMMGDKIEAKKLAGKLGIPLIPGTVGFIKDPAEAVDLANKIGYPVLIKAVAGGGGKGMRIANTEEELLSGMIRAESEAIAAFGDGRIYLEKMIDEPRHVEFQVLGDKFGNIVHLYERECSIQRRHQKIIEECPSPFMDSQLRKSMGDAAVLIAKGCQYSNAGTVEFIIDRNRNFYFLEMNTRLQVEHPVTEMVTGLDIVRAQILIAMDEPVPWKQEDIKLNGHSIEMRICAEDPYNDFLPNPGKLVHYMTPKGPGIRVDDGYLQGQEIPIQYDSLIGKLIVWDNTREKAIKRMLIALKEYVINGISSNIGFGEYVLNNPDFVSGNFNTGFIHDNLPGFLNKNNSDNQKIAAIIAGYMTDQFNNRPTARVADKTSKWKKRLN